MSVTDQRTTTRPPRSPRSRLRRVRGRRIPTTGLSTGFVLALACTTAVVSAGPALAAPGDLDDTFGRGGLVRTPFRDGSRAYGVAVQPDGKVVAAGNVGFRAFGVSRYDADGRLDPTFGDDGRVRTNFAPGADTATAVAIQPDGKVVAAGFAGDRARFAVARYNRNGTLDRTFGGDGKVTTDVTPGEDTATAMAIQPDGRIVAAGSADNLGRFALARFDPDGSLDPGFGDNGIVTHDLTRGYLDVASAVAIQPDGRIVAAGSAGGRQSDMGRFTVVRYDPDGSLDLTFSDNGRVSGEFASHAYGVALQADGKIVAAGLANLPNCDCTGFALARYTPDGALDTTFGSRGKAITTFTAGDLAQANAVAIQPDGRIVAAGSADFLDGTFALSRYTPDGALDPSFGGDGRVTTNLTRAVDSANAVVIQPDGMIVAAGQARNAFGLARFLP